LRRLALSLGVLALGATSAHAALIDLANSPLVVSNTNEVKPNLFFILDDSGSMSWDYMPDTVRSNLCRTVGAGINAGATYSGTFSGYCCSTNDNSSGNRGTTLGACHGATGGWRGHPLYLAADFNGVAYNPAIRYLPPVAANGTEYPNITNWSSVPNDHYGIQDAGSTNLLTGYPDSEWCTDTTYTDCLRNGNYVLPGRVNSKNYTVFRATTGTGTGQIAIGAPDAATTQARSFGPHYYRIVPSEYCTSADLRDCQQGQSGAYTVPAPIRWCNSDANARAVAPPVGACQATRAGSYTNLRYPTKYFSPGVAAVAPTAAVPAKVSFSIALSGCGNNSTISLASLVVNGVDLLRGTPASNSNGNNNGTNQTNFAAAIVSRINAGTGTTNFSASNSGATITINAPAALGNFTGTGTLTRAGTSTTGCNFTPQTTTPAFGGYVAPTPGTPAIPAGFPGGFERVEIIPAVTTYPKGANRKDCGPDTQTFCTYTEEMTNFANWWAYYRTRMQTMKTSSSRAFADVGDNRRLGYTTLNKNANQDFVNLDTFTGAHKTNWFAKLRAASPSSGTPLRETLSTAGRMYAGRLNGTSIDGVTVRDPMQYSCQRNYTLLSTDGFWNGNGGVQLDGSTPIGNHDGDLERPKLDGRNDSGTLADVAAYYFRTDLRDGPGGVCTSGSSGFDVCGTSTQPGVPSEVQNMRVFTLGLGVPGFMRFQPDYATATTGDFYAIKQGLTANPAGGICTWQASGICNWPQPVGDTLTAIDDLWHAAVNADGAYFSASDPRTLYEGIYNALTAIDVTESATAAATTSNPNITSTDNQIFVSSFRSGEWTGELLGQRINVVTGNVETAAPDWSAGALLNTNTNRNVLMFSAGAPTKLKPFEWSQMTASEKSFFQLAHVTAAGRALSQFCSVGPYCVTAVNQAIAAGEPLVQYLAGNRSLEGGITDPTRYFRQRAQLLGDIVNSEAVFVSKPNKLYGDAGYAAFVTANASRAPMVYVGANDGMLHAFNANTGQEVWAYVPTAVLDRLYKLADKEYATKHEYYVDATPTVQDVFIGGAWKTILVGGLGAGGRAYYALDITDPTNPKALWEFSSSNNANLGFSYGKPIIGKLMDGTWAVLVTSGYNNVSPGNGQGYLFVLNAATGAVIRSIGTGVGDTGTPSGLAHIRGWYERASLDATILRVYGGDNLGNVWRFDVNNVVGNPGYDAQRLAVLRAGNGAVQPVTSRPELGLVGNQVMVYVGTGRYLGTSDLTDTTQQSIYAIKDRMTNEDYGNVRLAAANFVQQTLALGGCPAGSEYCSASEQVRLVPNPQPVDLAVNGGFFVDLPVTSERVNTEPVLALGTLIVTSNIIESGNVCRVGGSSWLNFLDYATGASVSTANGLAGVSLSNGIGSRATVGILPSGAPRTYTTVSDRPRGTVVKKFPVKPQVNDTQRHSWRDLTAN
jgi:type IV pilus assembly protein PilY1